MGGMGPAVGGGGAIVLLILSLIFGRDFVSGNVDQAPPQTSSANGDVAPVNETPGEHQAAVLVSNVLDDAQSMWAGRIKGYRDAKLVLFRDATPTGCGTGMTAMGPFYCPEDEKVYIDLGFYDQLRDRFGAPGDFAEAYVIAHELGHHVQHLTGQDQAAAQSRRFGSGNANQLSVALELQADCYAGVWGHDAGTRGHMSEGDIEEGLAAAASVGDDRIQRQATGHVNSDSFTHGSSAQRVAAFRKGYESGDPGACRQG